MNRKNRIGRHVREALREPEVSPKQQLGDLVTIIRTPDSMVIYDFAVMCIVLGWALILNVSKDFIETSITLSAMLRIYTTQTHMAFHLGCCVLSVVLFRIYRWRAAYAVASVIRMLFWTAIIYSTFVSDRLSTTYIVYGTFLVMDFVLLLKIVGIITPPPTPVSTN